ncbi:MAG: alpha-ketoglutarate-dependent dioxygenase AlkB family protein [Empedobacter falsenii]
MDLFNDLFDGQQNLLPKDGTVHYFGQIMTDEKAYHYYSILLNEIEWKNDQAIIFGKLIETKRKIAWYGDFPFAYTYSKITKTALPWTDALLELKKLAEEKTGETYNSCLVNLYHDGSEGMAWHSDGEKQLKRHDAIASLSFGAERKFGFKHKETKEVITLNLASGSLLVMKNETQDYWLHRLPTTKKVNSPRINLTFRTIDLEQ